jgi:hypothetical protein
MVAAGASDSVAASGWYNRASSGTDGVEVDVSASDPSGVTHLGCTDGPTNVLDVAAAGGTFTLSNGTHSITCTATDGQGNTGAGDGSTAMPVEFKVDQTPPTVTCQSPAPQFLLGATGKHVTASVTDITSGPADATVSAAANTSSAGGKTVSLTGSDKAGNSTTAGCAYTVVYGFGGFMSPVPKSTMTYNAGSNIPVKFVLTNASGQPIAASTASALASGGNVKATLSGPNSTTVVSSALCSWNATGLYFQCNVKTPSGLRTGKSNAYMITALENVGGGFVTAPPYTNTAADANPETIYFK